MTIVSRRSSYLEFYISFVTSIIIVYFLVSLVKPNIALADGINVGNMFGISTDHQPYNSPQNTFCNNSACNQCTAFAWGRAMDRLGVAVTFSVDDHRHACKWPIIITNSNIHLASYPEENSFAIWEIPDGTCDNDHVGHVAYVEKVDSNGVYINEANWETYTSGGGYDGYTKLLTETEIENRNGYVLKGYLHIDTQFSNYYYWNFDTQGTEDWNARNALNQGIFTPSWAPDEHYWQIGSMHLMELIKEV